MPLLASCKFQPNAIRSELKTSNAFQFIAQDSIGFKRNTAKTEGELFFELKSDLNCRIEYWSDDLSVAPNITAPLALLCPETTDRAFRIPITDLVPGSPYSFKIVVWPKSLDSSAAAAVIFREGGNLEAIKSDVLVIAKHVRPRRASELYAVALKDQNNLSQIKQKIFETRAIDPDQPCQLGQASQALLFEKPEDQNSLFGLKDVSSDGYGRAVAELHPFHEGRLKLSYESIESRQNWQWRFNWNQTIYNFEVLPPGYITEFNLVQDESIHPLSSASLAGAVEEIDLSTSDLQIEMQNLFPQEIAYLDVLLKDRFNPENSLHCRFSGNESRHTIASDLIGKLKPGTYDFVATFETIQIHYIQDTPYPPWVISSQDWVFSRLRKRL